MSWGKSVAVAFDQFVGVALGITRPGETISARAGLARRKGKMWGCIICRLLDFIERDHCELAIAADAARAAALEAEDA